MIYILRRLEGLKKINNIGDIKANYANSKNEDPVASEFFKGNFIPGATASVGLPWDDLRNRFCFYGTEEDLDKIVKKLRLKHEDGDLKGSIIEKSNILDIGDPFFNHEFFFSKFVVKDGELLIDDSIPEQELLVRSLKDNRQVIDRTKDNDNSIGAIWELVSPLMQEETIAAVNDVKMNAYSILNEKAKDSLEMIALILSVDYDANIPGSAKNKIFESIEKNRNSKKFGVKFVDKFLELAAKSRDELIPMFNVRKGEDNGLLSFNGSYYQFKAVNSQAETTINVRSTTELINYFDKNPEQLKILIAENENR